MTTHQPQTPAWPAYLPKQLVKPDTPLYANLEVAALRYADRTAIGFFGGDISYRSLLNSAERFAAWLHAQQVRPGDRVMVFMQNAPQWLMAYYGILRAGAVLVPANPMNKASELRKILDDSGAVVIVCAAELVEVAEQASQGSDVRAIVATSYHEYLPQHPIAALPEWMTQVPSLPAGVTAWAAALAQDLPLPPKPTDSHAICALNYTSGSTGEAKGCMHTHRSLMHTTVGLVTWHNHAPGTAFLGVAPMYQVAGFTVLGNCVIYAGGMVVPVPRWDRKLAMALIAHYRVHFAGIAPTAIIDMLSDPDIEKFDLRSLKRVSFGGATMPESVWREVNARLGLSFIEAYGMTETAATTHINPIERPKRQCLGIPFFDTQSLIVNPDTLAPCPVGEPGEILIAGPQLFQGYWQRPEDTAAAFVEIDGTRYFRSGDIGVMDDEGYFFMTDRVKRMINASGFKVWPAEVENQLYAHPAVKEACVISAQDSYRGETVKAVVVLKDSHRGQLSAEALIAWARDRMAAYKYPRIVEFVDQLPKSPVGKILWRELQDAEQSNVKESTL